MVEDITGVSMVAFAFASCGRRVCVKGFVDGFGSRFGRFWRRGARRR